MFNQPMTLFVPKWAYEAMLVDIWAGRPDGTKPTHDDVVAEARRYGFAHVEVIEDLPGCNADPMSERVVVRQVGPVILELGFHHLLDRPVDSECSASNSES